MFILKENEKKMIKNPIIIINKPEQIQISVGAQLSFFGQSNDILPSDILKKARIIMPDKISWKEIDFRQKHHFNFIKTEKKSIIQNEIFQIESLEEILDSLHNDLPTLRPSDFLDWPFLFSAQVAYASQMAGVSPTELFRIFCIDYKGPTKNSWMEFPWFNDLEPIWVEMKLKDGGHHAGLQ